jgi:sulfur carrier protein ThiS adenylyltransferase
MNSFEQNLERYLSNQHLGLIRSKKIGIGGAGGIGANAALILARSGFRHFEIIDSDQVDYSNLNRQPFFLADVGADKVTALKRHLLAINPELDVQIHKTRWTPETAGQFFHDCEFILEGFDEARTKHDFVDFYQSQAPYVVSASGMAGFDVKNQLPIRQVGNIFIVGDQKSDVAKGHSPLAPRVIGCAARMAEIVLSLTLNSLPSPWLSEQ